MADLQGPQVVHADRRVGQRAEAGVHPVDRGIATQRCGDHGQAVFHPGRHVRAETGRGLTVGDRYDVLDGEGAAIDDHFSHGPSLPGGRGWCGPGASATGTWACG